MDEYIMMEVDGGEVIVVKKGGFLSIFKKFALQNEQKKRNAIYSKEADNFLNAQYYDHFLQLMLAGYIPNKKQKKKWDNHVKAIIMNSDFERINDYLEKGLEFTDEIFHLCFKNTKLMIFALNGRLEALETYKNKRIKVLEFNKDKALFNKIRDVLNSDRFEIFFKEYWIKEVKAHNKEFKRMDADIFAGLHKYDYSVNVCNDLVNKVLGLSDIILNDMSYNEFIEKVQHWNNLTTELRIGLESDFRNNKNPEKIKDLLNKASLAINSHLDKVGNDNQVIKTLKLKQVDYSELKKPELPKDIVDILTAIEDKYVRLKNHNNLLLATGMERTIEEQVPKIVNNFLAMDNAFKTKLVDNKGLNALDLTIDSLKTIENKLDEKIQMINEEHLHSINVLNRYTKNI